MDPSVAYCGSAPESRCERADPALHAGCFADSRIWHATFNQNRKIRVRRYEEGLVYICGNCPMCAQPVDYRLPASALLRMYRPLAPEDRLVPGWPEGLDIEQEGT